MFYYVKPLIFVNLKLKNIMKKTIELSIEEAREMYKTADASLKKLLLANFTASELSVNIMDRVKSFEDACKIDGLNPENLILRWQSNGDTNDEIAYKKLKIIAKVLNEGWSPNWKDTNECKYYPWFEVGSSGFSYHDFSYQYTYSYFAGRLCFKTKNLAIYFGKTFIDIHKEFYI